MQGNQIGAHGVRGALGIMRIKNRFTTENTGAQEQQRRLFRSRTLRINTDTVQYYTGILAEW